MVRKHLVPFGLLLLAMPARAGKTETLDAFLREGRFEAGFSAFVAPSASACLDSLAEQLSVV